MGGKEDQRFEKNRMGQALKMYSFRWQRLDGRCMDGKQRIGGKRVCERVRSTAQSHQMRMYKQPGKTFPNGAWLRLMHCAQEGSQHS